MRILLTALATSILALGSSPPGFAQSNDGSVVTILKGGRTPSAMTNSLGTAAPASNGVTIMTGVPIVVSPQQTAALPSGGAAIAPFNGTNASGGFGAGTTNPSDNFATTSGANGNATGAPSTSGGSSSSGGTISAAPRGIGGARGGFGFK